MDDWIKVRQLINEVLNQKSMPQLTEAWLAALKQADYMAAMAAARQLMAYTMLRLVFTNQDEAQLIHLSYDLEQAAKTGWPDMARLKAMRQILTEEKMARLDQQNLAS